MMRLTAVIPADESVFPRDCGEGQTQYLSKLVTILWWLSNQLVKIAIVSIRYGFMVIDNICLIL